MYYTFLIIAIIIALTEWDQGGQKSVGEKEEINTVCRKWNTIGDRMLLYEKTQK